MRKSILYGLCILLALSFFGCVPAAGPKSTQSTDDSTSFTVINEVAETDLWIIPDTEENRKTTLWGTATVASLAAGDEVVIPLGPLGGPGNYLFRAIDKRGIYYEGNDFRIEDGYTLRLIPDKGVSLGATLEIRDAQGNLIDTISVFAGRL